MTPLPLEGAVLPLTETMITINITRVERIVKQDILYITTNERSETRPKLFIYYCLGDVLELTYTKKEHRDAMYEQLKKVIVP